MKLKIPTEAEIAELVSTAGPVAAALAHERDLLREMVQAKDSLLACYRTGKQPSESLHNKLAKLRQILYGT